MWTFIWEFVKSFFVRTTTDDFKNLVDSSRADFEAINKTAIDRMKSMELRLDKYIEKSEKCESDRIQLERRLLEIESRVSKIDKKVTDNKKPLK